MTVSHRLRRLPSAALCFALALLFALPGRAEPYRVAPGDTLSVSIFAQPELSGDHRVREDGAIVLHLIGPVPVAGLTVAEASTAITTAAESVFEARPSVIAEMAAYRDIFVLGDVARPGAYAFTPGLTVVKALALAGDMRRGPVVEDSDARRITDERRQLLLARARIDETKAIIASVDAELARLDADGTVEIATPDPEAIQDSDDLLGQQRTLINARRDVMARAVDGAARQQRLAAEEAELFRQRNALVARQIEMTEENLQDIDTLVARGLARRDRQLSLSVSVDDYRSDSLEIAAFEARARQLAANAENNAAVAVSRYREALMSDRIAAARALEVAEIEFATSRDFLQSYGDTGAAFVGLEPPVLRYEIMRDGETIPAEEGTALQPADVVRATLSAASDK